MGDRWVKVALRSEVPEGGTLLVAVGGEPVCLYNIDGTIYATHDICTHEEASLAEGFVDGDCIECPLHQALFHIPTGKARTAPATDDLRVYPVEVSGDDVLVDAGEGGA
jgi:nitrite reductase/ring-hydroxylating ferredoxin subunit